MTDIPIEVLYPLLHRLAKRVNPDMDIANDWGWVNLNRGTECLICHQQVSIMHLVEHGTQHVKEHNLLPFL
jgi:hypothetical protein